MGGGDNDSTKQFGLPELTVFAVAIVTGTACALCSKTMMEMTGKTGSSTDVSFSKPIFQTFGMFAAMSLGLVLHGMVVALRIPFPGYSTNQPSSSNKNESSQRSSEYASETDPLMEIKEEEDEDEEESERSASLSKATTESSSSASPMPLWMYFCLAIPAVFDLTATGLCMMGLQYINVSIYQLLRGSGIIFVALVKQHVLGDHLYRFQWVGVLVNCIAVALVGSAAIFSQGQHGRFEDEIAATDSSSLVSEPGRAALGVFLVMIGAFVQALQFVFEEKVMSLDESAVPPLLLIGMEGLWGSMLCLFIIYPAANFLEYDSLFDTLDIIWNSRNIQIAVGIYITVILGYNVFAVLVTYMLSSIWHSILDNFRPITVWLTNVLIFYAITAGSFGEPWTTWSWLQLFGMFVLLYGTAIYNAPNSGSLKLEGQWFAFGLNMKQEYDEIEKELHHHPHPNEKEHVHFADDVEEPLPSAGVAHAEDTHHHHAHSSPVYSVHAQALAGYGSQHI